MNAENPGNRNDLPTPSEGSPAVERGAISPEDINGLTPDQLDDKIKAAIAEFNKSFDDCDPQKVREAFCNEEPRVTRETLLNDLDGLEQRVMTKLAPESAAETPEARNVRLAKFVETNFADICPPEHCDAATSECLSCENDMRDLFEEPDLQLSQEDAADPSLIDRIKNISAVEANTETISTLTATRDSDIAARDETAAERDRTTQERTTAEAEGTRLETDVSAREQTLETEKTREAEKEADLATIEQLQTEFNTLKAEKGTIGALRTLLEPGRLKSPEMRAKVEQAISTAQTLVNAIPEKTKVVNRILDQSNINFAAASPVQIFAGFLAEADKSDELTEEEKSKLREVLHGSERLDSGGAVEEALRQGRGVRMNADGKPEPIPYDKDNSLPIRPGVDAYMDGNREIMRARAGANVPARVDVTGWSAAEKADLLKVMSFWTATESVGKTGFVQDIYGLNFGGFVGGTEFNREQVRQMKGAISLIYGGAEGYDGDLGEFDQQIGLVQYQARLLSETGTATGMENDQAGSQRMDVKLGLKDDSGNINPDVLRAFGEYTRSTYMTGDATTEDLHRHLFSLYPDLVEPPETSA